MNPIQVNPHDWQNHEVIFNDAEFSAVWGQYQGNLCLGIRWNGDDLAKGYPLQGAYPLWFVAPDLLTLSNLERFNTVAIRDNLRDENYEPYSNKIGRAIREFTRFSIAAEQN